MADDDTETCVVCGKPAPDDDIEFDADGEAMHPGCRRQAEREQQQSETRH